MKLTNAQIALLDRMADKGRINFSSVEGQEIACQLDALGLAVAYTDSSNSLGLVIAAITPAGRQALATSKGGET